MKTLSDHIQESFNPIKEDNQQTIAENLNDTKEEVVNENESLEKEKLSE